MLPLHWVEQFSHSKQRKYYVNSVNMVRTWKRPCMQGKSKCAGQPSKGTQKSGKKQVHEKKQGKKCHASSHQTAEIDECTWKRPCMQGLSKCAGQRSKGTQKSGKKQAHEKKQGKKCHASSHQTAEMDECTKTTKTTKTTATPGQTGHDRFKGATVHEIGGGCAVLTFVDDNMEKLLPAAVEYVLQEGVLQYDKQFKMMQKMCTRRRGEGLFSDTVSGYAFSGTTVVATSLPSCLRALLDYVNQFFAAGDTPFTAVFVNHYRGPDDAIYMHSDKDVAEDEEVGVVAISWGMPRKLKFRATDSDNPDLLKLDIETARGQALVMYGYRFQSLFKHGITAYKDRHHHKTTTGQGPSAQGRVSFTFRRHHSTRA